MINGVFLALALITILPSYWVLPFRQGEVNTRALRSRVRADLRLVAGTIESKLWLTGTLPSPMPGTWVLPDAVLALAEAEGALAGRRSGFASHPPLAVQRFAALATSPIMCSPRSHFPFGLAGVRYTFPSRDPTEPYIYFHAVEDAFLLWSLGPGGEMPPPAEVAEWFEASPEVTVLPLLNHLYDPTNGSLSLGIIYRSRGDH